MSQYTIVSTPAVLDSGVYRAATEKANPWLAEVLKPSPERVTAEWDRAGSGTDALILRLSDSVSSIAGIFHPDELSDQSRAETRFSRLYSELLRVGSRVLVDRLVGSTPGPNGGE